MTVNISFKQMDPSETLKGYTNEKADKLAKYFRGRISTTWNFTHERESRIVHCHLIGNNMDYFAEAATEDFRVSIDQVVDKIEKQIRKHKEIVKDHKPH